MPFKLSTSVEIIEMMENYIFRIRPPENIRAQLDVTYEIQGQSIILSQVRPVWDDPKKTLVLGYAKATYVKTQNIWKIYWKRADGKWHLYKPFSSTRELKDFLLIVDKDAYGCFGA